jgi:hypothetical protein
MEPLNQQRISASLSWPGLTGHPVRKTETFVFFWMDASEGGHDDEVGGNIWVIKFGDDDGSDFSAQAGIHAREQKFAVEGRLQPRTQRRYRARQSSVIIERAGWSKKS